MIPLLLAATVLMLTPSQVEAKAMYCMIMVASARDTLPASMPNVLASLNRSLARLSDYGGAHLNDGTANDLESAIRRGKADAQEWATRAPVCVVERPNELRACMGDLNEAMIECRKAEFLPF